MEKNPLKKYQEYEDIQRLIKLSEHEGIKGTKKIRKFLKRLEKFVAQESRINENMAAERYALDYSFFSAQLDNFTRSCLGAILFVVANEFQHKDLRSDEYHFTLEKGEQTLTLRVNDIRGFQYMHYEYGCRPVTEKR